MNNKKKYIYDLVLILCLCLIAILLMIITKPFSHEDNLTAQIWYKDEIIEDIDLNKESDVKQKTYTFPEGTIEIEYKHNSIRVLSSSCPNKTCVNQGWSDKTNKSIICIHNSFRIKIISKSDVDVVVG